MHEVAYAEGILGVALDVAQGARVRRIQVRAGAFHAIVPDSLQFCFQLVAQDTPAADATLEVMPIAGDEFLVDAVELDDGWHRRPGSEADAPMEPFVREHMLEHAHVVEQA